jgi:hypothetical protein
MNYEFFLVFLFQIIRFLVFSFSCNLEQPISIFIMRFKSIKLKINEFRSEQKYNRLL